jgi:anti-anti-sigma factor
VSLPPYRATTAALGSELSLVSVSGELDLYVGPDLRASLASADGATVVLDLSGVAFLDSTICALVVGEARRRRESGGELVVVSNGSHASRALELAGIDRVLRMFPTLHSALQVLLVPQ